MLFFIMIKLLFLCNFNIHIHIFSRTYIKPFTFVNYFFHLMKVNILPEKYPHYSKTVYVYRQTYILSLTPLLYCIHLFNVQRFIPNEVPFTQTSVKRNWHLVYKWFSYNEDKFFARPFREYINTLLIRLNVLNEYEKCESVFFLHNLFLCK